MYDLNIFSFEGDEIQVIIDERDGTKWIPIARICENLGIDPHTQQIKIKNDPKFNSQVILGVAKDCKNRGMLCICLLYTSPSPRD